MSKYPYFGKKGRPSKEEADLCKKINKLVNSGEVTDAEINKLIDTDGMPTNLDELQDMYSYLTGEEVERQSQKLYTGDLEDGDDNNYENDDYENNDYQEINTNQNFSNVNGNKNAVGFDPFSEPVIERGYTKGINISNEQEEEDDEGVEFDENDFQRPEGGESVAEKITSNNNEEEIEEDIPEPSWSNYSEAEEEEDDDDDEYSDEEGEEDSGKLGDGNLDDLSPAQKRKSAEKTAEAILQMYCKFAPTPFKSWAKFKDTTIQKMVIDGRLDLNMQLENGVTVKDYIDGTNEQVEEIFEVSEETKQEIKDPLVDVLLEQEIALTPTQRLLLAVGSHVVQMGFSAYQLSQNNKMALESFEKFHSNMRRANPQYQEPQQQSPRPEPREVVPDDRITGNDREAVDELMKELNKDDDGIIDAEHDPSIEIMEDYSDED